MIQIVAQAVTKDSFSLSAVKAEIIFTKANRQDCGGPRNA